MAAATHAQTRRSKRSIGIGSASGLPAQVNAAGFQESRMCGDARSGPITLPLLSAFLNLASWHLLRWLWPLRVRVIIGSGKCRPAADDIAPGTRFLQKPYALEVLIREVRRLTAA